MPLAMMITNTTRQTTIANTVGVARWFWQRFMGLMGKPGLPEGHGLWIMRCSQIHSCFMRFPFDAIFIDKHNTIVGLVENMPAWRLSSWFRGAAGVLELPAGTIAKSRTDVGDVVSCTPPLP